MIYALLVGCLLILAVLLVIAWSIRQRIALADPTGLQTQVGALEKLLERAERTICEAVERSRVEAGASGRELRTELQSALTNATNTLVQSVDAISKSQNERLGDFAKEIQGMKSATAEASGQLRQELVQALKESREGQERQLTTIAQKLDGQLESFGRRLTEFAESIGRQGQEHRTELTNSITTFRETVTGELKRVVEANENSGALLRKELSQAMKEAREGQERQLGTTTQKLEGQLESFGRRLGDFGESLTRQQQEVRTELTGSLNTFRDSTAAELKRVVETTDRKGEELRTLVDAKLLHIQQQNEKKLEEMRVTVDEKLQGTLERRLGESFKIVSERLDQVHKGLGEMQALATGVGDLKRVLMNVKTRGTWGEVQLENLLAEILTPDQYGRNVIVKPNGRETVEFAIRLPGREDKGEKPLWLPIDAKFPKEDYERLIDAEQRADPEGAETARKALEARVRAEARQIRDKYIAPPHTTNFAVLYLPTEGLYAEIARRPGVMDDLQRQYRVTISGPSNIAMLLNSLQMGFTSLAIQKRSSQVWQVLGAVKTEFRRFGEVIDKVKKKIGEAGKAVDDVGFRSEQMVNKLNKVSELPAAEAALMLDGGEAAAAAVVAPLTQDTPSGN